MINSGLRDCTVKRVVVRYALDLFPDVSRVISFPSMSKYNTWLNDKESIKRHILALCISYTYDQDFISAHSLVDPVSFDDSSLFDFE